MKKLLLILITVTFLTSCVVTHMGTISSSSTGRNVKYEDVAFGVSQTNKFLGLGGVSKDALVLEAKRALIMNRALKPNEEYVNFTVDFKNTYWPFYVQNKVTLSADVVRFTSDTSAIYSDIYRDKLLGKTIALELFNVGDSVFDNKYTVGTILTIDRTDKITMLYKTKDDKFRTKKISTKDIYSINHQYKGYKTGEYYVLTNSVNGNEQSEAMKIAAVGLNSVILKDRNNKLKIVKY